MFDRRNAIDIDPAFPPVLIVTIDTEAEFDWNAPFLREQTGVGTVASQHPAQEIMANYAVVPTYLVDHAVLGDDAAVAILQRLRADKAAEIGAHLNPWLAPPFTEALSSANSFAGNLEAGVERAKLTALTGRIEAHFGEPPLVYRAGRFGIGPNTPEILQALGYRVDMSIAPHADFSPDGGPDFSGNDPSPFWLGDDRDLLEIPVTWAYTGALAAGGRGLHRRAEGLAGSALHLPGILARLGVIEFVRLTPEGETFNALRKLTETLLRGGARVFSLSYHSPSLAPGNTPYVRSAADLARFLDTLDRYFAYFFTELNGVAMTPPELHARLSGMPEQRR